MKLHLADIPGTLLEYGNKDEVLFIRSLMSGLLNHPRIEISQTNIPNQHTVSFSNTGLVMSDLPTNKIWTDHARQLYPAEKGASREVRLVVRSLYDGYDRYDNGMTLSGYEYPYKITDGNEVLLVTHSSVGYGVVSENDISTFSIAVTTKGAISRACFKVEIAPKSLS